MRLLAKEHVESRWAVEHTVLEQFAA